LTIDLHRYGSAAGFPAGVEFGAAEVGPRVCARYCLADAAVALHRSLAGIESAGFLTLKCPGRNALRKELAMTVNENLQDRTIGP
jgi:hypothetical protein